MAKVELGHDDYGVTAVVDICAETKEYIDQKCEHVMDVIHRKKWKDRARYTDRRKNSIRREKRWK